MAVLNTVELADGVPKSYVLGAVLFNMFINSPKTDRLLKWIGPIITKKLVRLAKTRVDWRFTELFLEMERLGNKTAGETQWKNM